MCLIAFTVPAQADSPWLIAANRDEYWQRPTLPLAHWQLPNGTWVLSGRDAQAGGTWLGITPTGRVAMLTNVRQGEPDTFPRSRGELVMRWLSEEVLDWPNLLDSTDPGQYGGFNLVLGDVCGGDWVWLSNRAHPPVADSLVVPLPGPAGWTVARLPPGVYGLSNAGLDSPWPKTLRLKQALAQAEQRLFQGAPATDWHTALLPVLLSLQPAAMDRLPNTGVAPERERALSSPFVHMPDLGYGTRSTSLVCGLGPQVAWQEWTHNAAGVTLPAMASQWDLAHSTVRHHSLSLDSAD